MKQIMEGLKVYLSGPISGYELRERRAFFDAAQEALEKCGAHVFNPMRNGLPADATTQEHMRADFRMLCECDAIVMLPKWNHSAGCINEFNVAISMGCQVHIVLHNTVDEPDGPGWSFQRVNYVK